MSNRDNGTVTIQASANSTDTTSMWFENPGAVGGLFVFNITAQSATAILPTFTVQGRVGNTTVAYNLGQLASTTPAGVATLIVYPGSATGGTRPTGAGGSTGPHDVVNAPLPAQFRVRSTNAGSGTVTWSGWVDLIG